MSMSMSAQQPRCGQVGRIATVLSLALTMALAGACGGDGGDSGDNAGDDTAIPLPDVVLDPAGESPVAPPQVSQGRSWRRMNLDQLSASMTQVSGGLNWSELDDDGQPFDVLVALSGSLGKPDFLNSNTEELEPGLLFQKFLDDAASAICAKWIARERDQAPSERRLLVSVDFSDTPETAAAAIDDDIRAALLRFHGRPIASEGADAEAVLAPWRRLISAVWTATGDMGRAWQSTCIAMFTHPDFYSF